MCCCLSFFPKLQLRHVTVVSARVNNTPLLINVCAVFTESEQAAPKTEHQYVAQQTNKQRNNYFTVEAHNQQENAWENPGQPFLHIQNSYFFNSRCQISQIIVHCFIFNSPLSQLKLAGDEVRRIFLVRRWRRYGEEGSEDRLQVRGAQVDHLS